MASLERLPKGGFPIKQTFCKLTPSQLKKSCLIIFSPSGTISKARKGCLNNLTKEPSPALGSIKK